MKNIIFILLLAGIFSQQTHSQEIFISPDPEFEQQCREFEFTGVVSVDSTITKNQLYQKSRQWFAEIFKSSKSVIENEDKDEGIIYGKGIIDMKDDAQGYVSFALSIRCKDGRIKYTFNDFMQYGARSVNIYGTTSSGSMTYDIGSLKQLTPDVSTMTCGMGKNRRDKMWMDIKSKAKRQTYYIIENLKEYMKKTTSKENDNW